MFENFILIKKIHLINSITKSTLVFKLKTYLIILFIHLKPTNI
jgi:hypothetical protein